MDKVLDVINKLQSALHTADDHKTICLPEIVVVGSQSSGKSSVLESIVGKDFLPRGSGIVTRCPIVLQLNNSAHKGDTPSSDKEYAEFLHIPDKLFFDFDEVRTELEKETKRITGKDASKVISDKRIHLIVHSVGVPDLTLVDLPGLTRLAVGDQPEDIDILIENMVLSFISNPNSIILAINPANVDLANSDALRLARRVDPNGDRTVGVLTKLDIMDPGTDASSILSGKEYTTRLGFIAVNNRSQKHLIDNIQLEEFLQQEMDFFTQHPVYSSYLHCCGYDCMRSRLSTILISHIYTILPSFVKSLEKKLRTVEDKINNLSDNGTGMDPVDSSISKQLFAHRLASSYSLLFGRVIDGFLVRFNEDGKYAFESTVKLLSLFKTVYPAQISSISNCELDDQYICNMIANSSGIQGPLFLSRQSFHDIVKDRVHKFLPFTLGCLDESVEVLIDILTNLPIPAGQSQRFPALYEKILFFTKKLVFQEREATRQMLTNMVSMEEEYINTRHPLFTSSLAPLQFGPSPSLANAPENASVSQQSNTHPCIKNNPSALNGDEHHDLNSRSLQTKSEANEVEELSEESRVDESDYGTSQAADNSSDNNPFYLRFSSSRNKKSAKKNPKSKIKDSLESNTPYLRSITPDSVRTMVQNYINIVVTNFQLRTPRIIMYSLINRTRDNLLQYLNQNLLMSDDVESLFVRPGKIYSEYLLLTRRSCLLKNALNLINNIDISHST